MKQGVNVLPIANPHQKMEGIQKVRPQEIEKMVAKAQQLPSNKEGDFIAVQAYEFKVDVFEEMENPNPNKKKKDNKKDNKKQGKLVNESKISAREKVKSQSKKEPQPVKQQNNKVEEQEEESYQNQQFDQESIQKESQLKLKQEQSEEQQDQEQQEEQEGYLQEEDEENVQSKQEPILGDGLEDNEDQEQKEENNEDEVNQEEINKLLDEQEQEQEQEQELDEEDQQVQESVGQEQQSKSNVSETSSKQRKFQSSYAELMNDLLEESQNQQEFLKPQPKIKNDTTQNVNSSKRSSASFQKPIEQKQDKESEQKYLKIIKQYQTKLKNLNDQLEQKQKKLPIIEEEEEDSKQKDFKDFQRELNVEQEVKNRVHALEVEAQESELVLMEKQKFISEMELKHKNELEQMKRQYESEIKKLKSQIKSQQEREEDLLDNILDEQDIRSLQQDVRLHYLDSEIEPSIDSNISSLLADDTELYANYWEQFKKQKQQRIKVAKEIINSRIEDLVDEQEVVEFMGQDISSRISISDVMFVGDALNLIKLQQDSSIGSLISERERLQMMQNPQFKEQTLPNSEVSEEELLSENKKLVQLLDSDSENFSQKKDITTLKKQLDQEYHVTEENKLDVYKQIAEKSKKEYEKQVQKLVQKKSKGKIRKRTFQSQLSDIDSSIGSLKYQEVPQELDSEISSYKIEQSSISSLISISGQEELLEQEKELFKKGNVKSISCQLSSSLISKSEKLEFENQMNEINSEIDFGNSSIGSLISLNEQQQLMKQINQINSNIESLNDINSKVSLSQQLSESQLLEMEEPKIQQELEHSRIHSCGRSSGLLSDKQDLIDLQESQSQQQWEQQSQQQEQSIQNSSIGSLIEEGEKEEFMKEIENQKKKKEQQRKKEYEQTGKSQIKRLLNMRQRGYDKFKNTK